jgi:hypothetical protein
MIEGGATIDMKTGVMAIRAICYTELTGPESELSEILNKFSLINEGPWSNENIIIVQKSVAERCNVGADGKPHCENGHDLKLINEPIFKRKGGNAR